MQARRLTPTGSGTEGTYTSEISDEATASWLWE